jgi:hypothetical protein
MKKLEKILVLIIIVSIGQFHYVYGQDPRLPSANLGFTNMQAGKSRPPGWYYIQYIQVYQPESVKGADGGLIADAALSSSIAGLQQLAFISNTKIWGGHIGGTVLVSLAKTSPDGKGKLPAVNPNPLGDLVAGPFIQWYDKHLFGMPLAHRLGINVALPTGGFQSQYDINPGAHRFRIFPHYEFTVNPLSKVALSIKNNLYYSFNEIGSPNRPAIAYNLNYALEFNVAPRLVLEAAGYYLTQLGQDSYKGDEHYYFDNYGITDTRERVFAAGPGLGYTTKTGLSLEAKCMWEMGAKNRQQGFRSTLVLSYRL